MKCLREGRPPALKLSAEAGADVGEEKASWKLCKGVDYKKSVVRGEWDLQEEEFSVT